MRQIKPEVIGFKILYLDMSPSFFNWSFKELRDLEENELYPAFVHPNGKIKLRPVYKTPVNDKAALLGQCKYSIKG